MIKLDFTNFLAAQDMIKIVEKDKNLSSEEAIIFSINSNNYNQILKTGWADIALSLWGHGGPNRKFYVMNDPCFEIDFEESKLNLMKAITKKYNVSIETAVSYFLIFTMSSLDYHI